MNVLAWLSKDQWIDSTAPITNGSDNRSPANMLRVFAQFPIETHPRYQPGPIGTWCNIAAGDLTGAMGCRIPHWIRGLETRANDLVDWLEHKLPAGGPMQGPEHGWKPVTSKEAFARANAGFPTVVAWKNPNPKLSGHIAVLVPSNVEGQIMVMQAGRTNSHYLELEKGFGVGKPLKFFTHD